MDDQIWMKISMFESNEMLEWVEIFRETIDDCYAML